MNVSQNFSLRDLIEQAAMKRDASVRRLTQLAQDEGFKVNHTTIGQLRNGSYKYDAPSTDTIRAIAWLAKVEDSVAFAAAGQPVPGPPLADELPPGADNLSPKARKALIDMARLLIEYEADNDNAQEQSTNNNGTPRLRAVAPEGDTRPGQKTSPEDLGVTEIFGEEARNYPLPDLDQMAAHPNFKSKREKWEEAHGERGEESQDPGEEF